MAVEDEKAQLVELNFSSTGTVTEDEIAGASVLWKDILKEGDLARTPGIRRKRPLKITVDGSSSASEGIISMADLMKSYDEKAFEDVSIPDGHPNGDSGLDNTGYVNALRVVKREGKHYLQAALGFTEPDVAAKVRRGSVPNVSAGILMGFRRKHDDKPFRAALNHVALTKTPFVHGLNPFARVFCSDSVVEEDDAIEIISVDFADEGTDTSTAEIVWNEQDGANWLRSELEAALTPDAPPEDGRPFVPRPSYYVQDVSPALNVALVEEFFKGDRTRWIIPFKKDGDKVTPAPSVRWIEGKEAMIAASDDQVDFIEITPDKLKEKLKISLSEMLDDDGYEIDEISMDRRVRVRKRSGSSFMTEFAMTNSGSVLIAPVSEWEQITSAEREPKSVKKNTKRVITLSDETPESRLAEARKNRRQLMSPNR